MSAINFITTREAAENLQVHPRTVRKWIDFFEEYICPDLNERGHYILSHHSLEKLTDIKQRLQEPNVSMKEVKEALAHEGKIGSGSSVGMRPIPQNDQLEQQSIQKEQIDETRQAFKQISKTLNQFGEMMEILYERMDRMEGHMYSVFDSFEEIEKQLVILSQDTVSSNEIHNMFDEIRKKQDQLKMELRNVNFSNRLAAAASETPSLPTRSRKKNKFLFFF